MEKDMEKVIREFLQSTLLRRDASTHGGEAYKPVLLIFLFKNLTFNKNYDIIIIES